MIKAFATDVDGTITDGKRHLYLRAIEGIRLLEKKGIPVILATGNVEPITKGLAVYVGTSGPIISENGGIISYNGKRELLANREKPDMAYAYVSAHLPVKKTDTDLWRLTEIALLMNSPVEKIRELLRDYEGVEVNTTGFAIHIYNSGINKGRALKEALSLLGIDLKDVAAIGDSENDIEMIERAGLGVAVENATSGLKKKADIVLTKGGGEGFLDFVRSLL